MSPGDAIPYGGGRLTYATVAGPVAGPATGPSAPVVLRPTAAAPVTRPGKRRLANDPINWWLIGLTIGYLAWSYYALPSSIWARLAFAVLLTIRMKPDIIIPYCLSCLQLKLNFAETLSEEINLDGGLAASMTGFESYAFAVPPLLISVRAAFAFTNARTDHRFFPAGLYLLWAVGAMFVVIGAFTIFRTGRGWTGAMRMYSIVGAVFYGLLMPRLKPAQINRLAAGLAVVCMALYLLAMGGRFGARTMFVIGPIGAAWGVTAALRLSRASLFAAALLFVTGSLSLFRMTFMVYGSWIWAATAAGLAWMSPGGPKRLASHLQAYVLATAIFCTFLFFVGVSRQVNDKSTNDGTFLGRVEWKLYADRGPIWSGCIRVLFEDPSILPTPERGFVIQWFGQEKFWENGPHNLELELLNQLGWVAGPIALLVLAYVVVGCTGVLARDDTPGARVIAIAAICSIVVGGLTLPYIVQDRQGEFLLFSAGLVIGSSRVNRLEALRMLRQPA
jgi:hypothetical protein